MLNSGRRAILTFVDYKDAFSSIAHAFLDKALSEANVSAKLRRLVRAVYAQAGGKVRVRCPDGSYVYSPAFEINRGVLQGDIYSPALFIIGLAVVFEMAELRDDGVRLSAESELRVSFQKYADDALLWQEVEEVTQSEHKGGAELEARLEGAKAWCRGRACEGDCCLKNIAVVEGVPPPAKDRRKREAWLDAIRCHVCPREKDEAKDAVEAAVERATTRLTRLATTSCMGHGADGGESAEDQGHGGGQD